MFENIGWIVEAKIKDGKRAEFEAVVEEIVAETRAEGGTLNDQHFVSDDGDVLVYERFSNVESAHIHITTGAISQSAGAPPRRQPAWCISATCPTNCVSATLRWPPNF